LLNKPLGLFYCGESQLPATFITRGYIEVWCNGALVSRHRHETEAVEALLAHADANPSELETDYELRYPTKLVKVPGIRAPRGDTVPPTTPTNLQATASSPTVVALSWSPSTDAAGGQVTYQVWRNGSPIQPVTVNTSFQDSGRTPGMTYAYSVSAYDSDGNMSAQSAQSNVTMPVPNTAPVWQSVPQQELTVGTSYSLTLTDYCADPDGLGLTFSIVTGTLPAGVTYNPVSRLLSGTPSAVVTTSVTFRASDGVLTSDRTITFRSLQADVTGPPAPALVSAVAVGTDRVDLTWSASVDATVANARTSGLAGYRVFRDDLFRAHVGNVLAWSDTGLAANTTYNYRILAYDVAGNVGIWSNPATPVTTGSGTTVRRYNPGYYSSMQRANDSQTIMERAIVRDAADTVDLTRGFLKRWTWRSFEPIEDEYVLATHELASDLDWCEARGLKLIVMIEDETYGFSDNQPAPDYLINYTIPTSQGGNTLARWDLFVHNRFKALLTAFSAQFGDHPALEAVMHEETSVGFIDSTYWTASGSKLYEPYTPEKYRDRLLGVIQHANLALPSVRWFFYMNFMPGNTSGSYLNQIVEATKPDIVICGPDAEEGNTALQTRTFWIYRDHKATCPIMCHLSTQTYDAVPNPTGEEMYDFAVNDLGANYICPVFQGSTPGFNWTTKIVPMMQAHPTFNVESW
jgi:chitodextrinase